ncbi:hypothetical protein QTJ16_006428 [Diplocarpon rosae]|uniref:Uncharacterized protein n=1 Tax=Diplocarpon rosae TaxID=946125 RepID=A0AAD9SWM3_9HELO|nr:hypothetical protein QTJ16_006428 [Diplocarpon rosae]
MASPDRNKYPMDSQQLALAALNRVKQSKSAMASSHCEIVPGKGASSTATATGMENPAPNEEPMHNAANTYGRPKAPYKSDRDMPLSALGMEEPIDALLAPKTTALSDISQSTTDGHDTASTAPTSTSDGLSSQSAITDGQLSQLSQLSQLAASQRRLSSSTRPILAIAPTAGQKRTADGQVKSSSISPGSPNIRGHSRNTSAVSTASSVSRIGELSSELRTRLSYAMVKVNNGWQSNSIDEVESLASHAGSPTSSNSTLHGRRNLYTSPRAAIANLQAQPGSCSQLSQANSSDFDLYPRGEQPSHTYESFWRSHSTPNFPGQRQHLYAPAAAPLTSKALGPPAEIRTTVNSRRSGTPKFSRQPNLPSHGSNSPYNTSTPRTPLRAEVRDKTIVQTPLQKTLQEQDAIETLLFMSSPGNSGNMSHAFPPPRTQASPQQSPLRSEFPAQNRAQHVRRVEFEATVGGGSARSSEGGAEYRSKIRSKAESHSRAKSEEMNRFLDEMRDSSSDEEEIPLTYSSPRRLAAGRV